MTPPMPPFAAAGLFGKIPAQGDFVRVRASDPVAQGLVHWLEEGSEVARRGGGSLPQGTARFVFHGAGAARALVGVLAPGRDKVGRQFPLAVFAAVDAGALAAAFPAAPLAAREFLAAAAALAADAPRLAAAELPGRLDALPLPTAGAWSAADEKARAAAAETPAREALGRLLGDPSAGQQHYALHCVRTACDRVRTREPAKAAAVLDCPVRDDVDRWTWLELVRRHLAWTSSPSFFWNEDGTEPWLLVSIGPPPGAAFAQLRPAPRRDAKLWPLTTPQAAAVDTARKALPPHVLAALDAAGRSLADLVADVTKPG